MSIYESVLTDPQFAADLRDVELSNRQIANRWGVGKTFVQGRRKRLSAATGDDLAASQSRQVTTEGSDGSRSVEGVRDRAITLDDARLWITGTGDNPDDYNLSIRSIAYGAGLWSNRMSATPKPGRKIEPDTEVLDIDPVAILAGLRNDWQTATLGSTDGDGAFVLSINDTQLGKAEGNTGTIETLARFDKFLKLAEIRIGELRSIGRSLGTLVIIGGGDIIEGCVIFPNQSYNIDLDRRGQINAAVTIILDTIDRLAPMFDRVIVLATRGNHGENRINGNRTTLYDNDDTLVFEMAQRATSRDPELQHVEYVIAQDEAGVWVDVAGWRLATTHGDVYGKGVAGASIDKKAQNWYKNMSMGRDPLGLADVLIAHHYHHDKMADWGACLWRQTPAQDGGSEYFRQSTGEYSESGMLTFVMTPGKRYQDESVLR